MNKKQMKEFMKALNTIVEEKGIDRQIVIEAMEQAMAAAYKKKGGPARCTVNPETGEIKLFSVRTVVEDENFRDEKSQISLSEAQKRVPDIEIGETIRGNELPLKDFGRVAAGTAKQIVVQRVKEAEKQSISGEFQDKDGELMVGTLSREDQKNYFVDLGRASGILPKDQIIPGEKLVMGSSVKVYVSKLEIGPKGPFIMLSRSHYGFVKRLFESEIPEFADGTLVMHGVAREAGVRSKVAVASTNPKVDPIGSCIGEKGRRIANIINELGGEKVDLIAYSDNMEEFIANSLSPAKNLNVSITDEKKKEALVIADDENLSLAIGKKGINIKLASRLTKYTINIKTLADINAEINK